jgi:hypothetical protein
MSIRHGLLIRLVAAARGRAALDGGVSFLA